MGTAAIRETRNQSSRKGEIDGLRAVRDHRRSIVNHLNGALLPQAGFSGLTFFRDLRYVINAFHARESERANRGAFLLEFYRRRIQRLGAGPADLLVVVTALLTCWWFPIHRLAPGPVLLALVGQLQRVPLSGRPRN